MTQTGKSRIWELDALRGLCILCVIVIHFIFDLQYFLGWDLHLPALYVFIQQYGGVIFVILSGCCVTLGSHSVRRGAIVFAMAMIVSAVTVGMIHFGMAGRDTLILFGVLHLLGICMMVYPLYRPLPTVALATLGGILVAVGYWFHTLSVSSPWLFPLGLTTSTFSAGDYFPLLPHLGWFMLGTVLGRKVYAKRRSLLPRVPADIAPLRFLRLCGRQSLWIYLLHQPLLYGALTMLT